MTGVSECFKQRVSLVYCPGLRNRAVTGFGGLRRSCHIAEVVTGDEEHTWMTGTRNVRSLPEVRGRISRARVLHPLRWGPLAAAAPAEAPEWLATSS